MEYLQKSFSEPEILKTLQIDWIRKLEIMKDSRIGTYGTLAIVSLLGLRFFTIDKRLLKY